MSDDFDFNADDLFDDDFDDFDDDDDFGGDDDFADDFGDDDFGADLDLGFMDDDELGDDEFSDDFDDDFGDDDFGATADEGDEGGPGISRPVMIIGGAMLVIMVLFLCLIVLWVINPGGVFRGDTEFRQTEAAILTENANIETQIAETATQSSINQTSEAEAITTGTAEAITTGTAAAQTEIAEGIVLTSDALTQAVEDSIAATEAQESANAEGTAGAIDMTEQANQDASANATQTEIAFQQTLNPNVTVPPLATTPAPEETVPVEQPTLGLPAVAQTATALAELFSTQPTTAPVQGTEIAAQETDQPDSTTGTTTGGTTTGSLPDTGLADDLFQAFFGDPRMAIVAVFGLLGVIVVSRSVRSANRKRDDD